MQGEIMLCLQKNVVVYFSTHVCILKLTCNDHKSCIRLKKITLATICTTNIVLVFFSEILISIKSDL